MDLTRIVSPLVAPAGSPFGASSQPLDLCSLSDLKDELALEGTASDSYLASLISRASAAATRYCNRQFLPGLWQEAVYPKRDPYPWQTPPDLTRLQLSQWPLLGGASPAGTAPPQAPSLGAYGAGGLAAQAYWARIAYVTAAGETALSLEASQSLAANVVLTIAAPGADTLNMATGYNVYVGSTSFGETRQNASPIGVNTSWTMPTSGLIAGAAPNAYPTIIENAALSPNPLADGVDFLADPAMGMITRLWSQTGQPRSWGFPITALYRAGFSPIPDDVQEAVLLIAKMRYFARSRDPMIRNQSVVGVYEAAYWLGTGLGGQGDLPVDVTEKLDRYRDRVVA